MELLLWAFAPGPVMCVVLFMGLVFGRLVWWAAVLGVLVFAILMFFDWVKGLRLQSFARGRSRTSRFFYVAGWLVMLIVGNLVEMTAIILVLKLVEQSLAGRG